MILNPAGEPVRSEPSEFKPCPFCGGKNIQPESQSGMQRSGMWYRCQTCSCTGGYDFTDDKSRERTLERWNTRSLEADVRKKTLEEMLQFLDTHTPTESAATAPVRLCFKVLRTELLKLTACKDMEEYLSKE